MSFPCPSCGQHAFQVDSPRITVCGRCSRTFYVPPLPLGQVADEIHSVPPWVLGAVTFLAAHMVYVSM